jgi:hypothetical protein
MAFLGALSRRHTGQETLVFSRRLGDNRGIFRVHPEEPDSPGARGVAAAGGPQLASGPKIFGLLALGLALGRGIHL